MEASELISHKPTTTVSSEYVPVKNLEEVFDTIVKHLLIQNERSENQYKGDCQYRSSVNLKCAIGCIISDEFYDELIEGSTADVEEVISAIQNSNPDLVIDEDVQTLFMLMQNLHDKIIPEHWFYMAFLYYRDMNFILQSNTSRFLENKKYSFGFPTQSYSSIGTAMNTLYDDAAYKMHHRDTNGYRLCQKEKYMSQLKENPSLSIREFFGQEENRMRELAYNSLCELNASLLIYT